MKHLSIRIAWHDNKWNGTICQHPSKNTYCIHLPRIKKEKDDVLENSYSGKLWNELPNSFLPPCKAEGGSFMNTLSYNRIFDHPYKKNSNESAPHYHLKETSVKVPPFTSFAVPFWWMLKENQPKIREEYPSVPYDKNPPFRSSWVYSNTTQNALLNIFFDPIKENKSLAIYYVKGANPLDENVNRLIAGVGTILKKSPIIEYGTNNEVTFPLWDRMITHGIKPNDSKSEGVLLPYHEYLELPDDYIHKTKDGRKTKYQLIDEIKLTLNDIGGRKEVIDEFAYGSKWVNNNSALIILSKLRAIVNRIIDHGIVQGHWIENLKWIDRQIGNVKAGMGPFPSFANAITALGFQFSNELEEDLRNDYGLGVKDNPWEFWEDVLFGTITINRKQYSKEFTQFKDIWLSESQERLNLLQLLSRFELTVSQIKKWFELPLRNKIAFGVSNKDILINPYIIAEEDNGDKNHYPIAVETIDDGLFADVAIQGEYIPEKPQVVDSPLDNRRVRALIISLLKEAALNGDTLMSITEITEKLNLLNLQRSSHFPTSYIKANMAYLIEQLVSLDSGKIPSLQLKLYNEIEKFLSKVLLARGKKDLEPLNEQWDILVKNVIATTNITFNPLNKKHIAALEDQSLALNKITNKKLAILHGPAGTGKTTVLGTLFGNKTLRSEGILLLAPTGKARVKLGKMANAEAFTIAQFLSKQKRYDWTHMEPLFHGKETYKGERNVIIDECSMLTVKDIFAIFKALDLAHVKRIILVGDPYQLPPIGPGRPFADLCNYLENLEPTDTNYNAKDCLARLNEVVRTVEGENSDALTLASWFSGVKPLKNADEVFSKLGDNSLLNDLQIELWNNEVTLYERLNSSLDKIMINEFQEGGELGMNAMLGIKGDLIDTDKIESFQVLTPVKAPFWGNNNINNIVQKKFRINKRETINIGDYNIGLLDKVIQTKNEWKTSYSSSLDYQLSNGQLGLVKEMAKGYANVVFSGIDSDESFGYRSQGQAEVDETNIELAYSITVHKSQGSDFEYVFLIVPKKGRIISRELIYTALTRAKKKLILILEGDNPHWFINLSKPQYSETAKRNTNLFSEAVREEASTIPFVEGLIHKTKKDGLLVRSKSEVIIANELVYRGLEFEYEKEFEAEDGQKRIPDFTFIDAAGERILLEHLGMLSIPSYKHDWEKKLKFYKTNGFELNENLFLTTESEKGGIDSKEIERVIDIIQELL